MGKPTVEHIHAPDCVEGSEGLLAIVIRKSPLKLGLEFFTKETEPLQVARMGYAPGYEVPAHVHYRQHRTTSRTQEVIVVMEGSVELTIYTSDGKFVSRGDLLAGDTVVLLSGGHSLKSLYLGAQCLEVKTGPYYGRDRDKRLL